MAPVYVDHLICVISNGHDPFKNLKHTVHSIQPHWTKAACGSDHVAYLADIIRVHRYHVAVPAHQPIIIL